MLTQLLPLALLLILGFCIGRMAERAHFGSIRRREREMADMFVTNLKRFPGGADPTVRGALVMGEVVIATDYFKSFLAGIRRIIGGELKTYQTLTERAKRESILRLMEEARSMGYNAVCNIRVDTADIGGMTGRKGVAMVEAFATGTGYRVLGHGKTEH